MEAQGVGDIIGNMVVAIGQVERTEGVKMSAREVLDWWREEGWVSEAEYRAVLLRFAEEVAA